MNYYLIDKCQRKKANNTSTTSPKISSKKYKNIVIADVKDISNEKIQKIRHEIISLGETAKLFVVKQLAFKNHFMI